MLDDAAKLDNAPPETLISSSVKSVDASERVKVIVVVSPAFNDEALDVISMVGAVVSIIRALFAPKELVDPGVARVRVPSLPVASFIVPVFNDSAEIEVKSRSLAVSPD